MVSRDEDLGLSASVLLDAEAIKRIASSDKAAFDELMLAVKDEERRRFLHYTPYTKQMEFRSSHAVERILSGANQSGKSLSGCMETCFHLTGEYPEWWTGHVVKPRKNATNGQMEINAWVVGRIS